MLRRDISPNTNTQCVSKRIFDMLVAVKESKDDLMFWSVKTFTKSQNLVDKVLKVFLSISNNRGGGIKEILFGWEGERGNFGVDSGQKFAKFIKLRISPLYLPQI